MNTGRHRHLAIALMVLTMMIAAGCDWTTYRGGPAHTGSVDETEIDVDNVAGLRPTWASQATDTTPVVAGGFLYTVDDWVLKVYDANGVDGCSGTPKVCTPLWTADAAYESPDPRSLMPTVAGGTVFLARPGAPLLAYDAAGETNCGGAPKVCQPLWSANTDSGRVLPTVAGGILYLTSTSLAGSRLLAFDAAGNTKCSGSPKVCQPLWVAPLDPAYQESSIPSVGDGRVFVVTNDSRIEVFDADGVDGCGGIPKTCTPLAVLVTGASPWELTVPAVAGGRVYVAGNLSGGVGIPGLLYAFDADGDEGCTGVPLTCLPLWRADAIGPPVPPPVPSPVDYVRPPAVSDGVVYQVTGTDDGPLVAAFSADGTTGCSGAPLTCAPLWRTLPFGAGSQVQAPVVAGDVLYVTATENVTCCQYAQHVLGYDATGSVECSGTPKSCAPVFDWTFIINPGDRIGGLGEPVVAHGTLFVTGTALDEDIPPDFDSRITAFKLP